MSNEAGDDRTQSVTILAPGAVISQYKLTRKLGVGGMGEVFLATDTKLQRDVALKFLSPDFAADESFRRRFMREAQTAARLNHPNVVTIYDVADQDNRVFIAMEAVEGKELREVMDQGPMPVDQAVAICTQICDGLAAAHAAGLVHRDIKPANILIDNSQRVRILDFGLAKEPGDNQLTQVGQAVGTVQYMSPEQGQGIDVDSRSDIFSVGIVFYEMVTGKLPFKKDNMPATIHSIVHEDPAPPSTIMPGLPSSLDNIIKRCLQKATTDRYPSINDFAIALREVAGFSAPTQITSIQPPPQQQTSRGLAVLPLKNLGPADDEFLAYGITEDLIVDLSRIGSMRITPMRSVLKYKDSDDDLEEIAARLKVGMVLDGSIQRTETAVRVSVQLIEISTGDALWAERWEEQAGNLPQIKRALAEGISKALQVRTTVIHDAQIGVPEAEDAHAYESYLKGKYTFDHKKDTSDIIAAQKLYRQALEKEPTLLAARAGIAEVLIHQADFTEAETELKSALEQAQGKDQAAEKANLLHLLAQLHIGRSSWEEAWAVGEQALQIRRESGDLAGEAEILGTLISVLQPQAKYDELLLLFDRVLEISRELDDEEKTAEALKNMGVAYSRQGEYDRALDLYDEALEVARKQGNLSLQAACLSNIGNVYYFQAEIEMALKYYNEALDINQRLGDTAGEARQNLNTGLIQLQRGMYHEGLRLFQLAAETFEALGDQSNLALTLCNISQLTLTLGDNENGLKTAQRALSMAEEIQHPLTSCAAHHRLGAVYFVMEDSDKAIEHYEAALDIATEGNMSRNMAHLHLDIAEIYYHVEDNKSCASHVKQAQSISREIGDKSGRDLVASYLAALSVRDGLYHSGIRQLQTVRRKVQESADFELKLHVEVLLGESLCRGPEADQAEGLKTLEAALTSARQREIQPQVKQISSLIARFTS
ncbi:MAG: protein kinase [candidate division Zixibacteria bacterium]|nr:protein kinase [candidate division Zixibacteria bacterium]MDH3935742.1 protein kinase [candidate division Zixibacteria bacterium]MDH4033875.1 protein kinase [candidate division Zixibacteria bacterium]